MNMQQELLKKKREIIELLLKKGILVTSELLEKISRYDDIGSALEVLHQMLI
jgi:hypothetical protein